MSDTEPNYTKPTSQLDLEARQADDYQNKALLVKGSDAEPSDNGFVGVDPIYQNFADQSHQPLLAEDGPEAVVEDNWYAEEVDVDKAAAPEGQAEAVEQAEEQEQEQTTASGSTQTVPSTTQPPASSTNPS